MTTYCVLDSGTVSYRTGNNEWYIDYGAWSFKILTDTSIEILHAGGGPKDKIINTWFCIFNTDDASQFGDIKNDLDMDKVENSCEQLDWKTLPPYEAPQYDVPEDWDDDIAF